MGKQKHVKSKTHRQKANTPDTSKAEVARSSSDKPSEDNVQEQSSEVVKPDNTSIHGDSKKKFSSPYATLSCPLCCDEECLLNKAATCPIVNLEHSVDDDDELCAACISGDDQCRKLDCRRHRTPTIPVSGLVPRDENGVAISLLKENGGPIEDSRAWANRRRWDVPTGIAWSEKVDRWISSAPRTGKVGSGSVDNSQSTEPAKKKILKKEHNTSEPPPQTGPVETSDKCCNVECDDQLMVYEGKGFKIFNKSKQYTLVNYESDNCAHLNCSCTPTDPNVLKACGCKS